MFLNLKKKLGTLESMRVFLNVLENIICTLLSGLLYISPKFWPYQLPMILEYFVLVNFLLLIYCNYFRNVSVGMNGANNVIMKIVWLKSSQYVVNRNSSPCSMVSIFVILIEYLIFAFAGN